MGQESWVPIFTTGTIAPRIFKGAYSVVVLDGMAALVSRHTDCRYLTWIRRQILGRFNVLFLGS